MLDSRVPGSALNFSAAASSALTTDALPPTEPTSLNAAGASPTQIGLSWFGATDNAAVGRYFVERCAGAGCTNFVQIAVVREHSGGRRAQRVGRDRYRVRAVDTSGRVSPYSPIAESSTSSDTQAPTVPGALDVVATSSTQLDLAWTPSTDDVAVSLYLIERCEGPVLEFRSGGHIDRTEVQEHGARASDQLHLPGEGTGWSDESERVFRCEERHDADRRSEL